jgi:hypothetical protein
MLSPQKRLLVAPSFTRSLKAGHACVVARLALTVITRAITAAPKTMARNIQTAFSGVTKSAPPG